MRQFIKQVYPCKSYNRRAEFLRAWGALDLNKREREGRKRAGQPNMCCTQTAYHHPVDPDSYSVVASGVADLYI